MRALLILILVSLAVSCAQVPPTAPIPSPTATPPKPIASTTLAPGKRAPTRTPGPPITSPEPIPSSTPRPGQRSPTRTPGPPITFEAAGVEFQIEDAAVYGNCLTVAFAVRGFRPPTGLQPLAFLPPARSIDVRLTTPDGELLAEPLGGYDAEQGNEGDGRIWLQQRAAYHLPREIPPGQEVALEVTAILDADFQTAQPLSYRFSVVSGAGASSCP